MMKKITTKLNLILIENKTSILISVLFILGAYHLLMSLVKLNAFNLNEDEIKYVKFILIRFYHISTMLLIGLGISFNWSKIINVLWFYLGFRLIYTVSLTIDVVNDFLSKSLIDGVSFGILIIIILILLSAKSY